MPLVERALRFGTARVQPQLGLLKSTMLQLIRLSTSVPMERKLLRFRRKAKRDDLVNVTGTGGRYVIERKGSSHHQRESQAGRPAAGAAGCIENHRLDIENGVPVEELATGSRKSIRISIPLRTDSSSSASSSITRRTRRSSAWSRTRSRA